jgi:hypothetical protein
MRLCRQAPGELPPTGASAWASCAAGRSTKKAARGIGRTAYRFSARQFCNLTLGGFSTFLFAS